MKVERDSCAGQLCGTAVQAKCAVGCCVVCCCKLDAQNMLHVLGKQQFTEQNLSTQGLQDTFDVLVPVQPFDWHGRQQRGADQGMWCVNLGDSAAS